MNSNNIDTKKYAAEYFKCKKNVIYFFFNYVFLPEIGSSFKPTKENTNVKLVHVLRLVVRVHKVLFMASRQLGKSSISAVLIAWAITFYPGNKAVILNMKKEPAIENLKRIKFIIENLPEWLIKISQAERASKAEIKTYLELQNGSRIDIFYTSGNANPENVARSLTAPILYIDEAAFIRYIEKAYGSAQPILSKAREQAAKNGYPYFILATSTPNGIYGDGKFFYDIISRSVDSDNIFDENGNIIENYEEVINDETKNSFVSVTYHWSEDETKDENWYKEQVKELNFDKRRINQELDLIFLGGDTCIFDDDILAEFKPCKPIDKIRFEMNELRIYEEFNSDDYYIIGVDTAKSITGDFCAVEIYSYLNFSQVGEYFKKIGSITKYCQLIQQIVEYIYTINPNIILCIERNSIGNQVVEYFENLEKRNNPMNIDFIDMIYSQDEDVYKLGIYTNAQTKDQMVSFFYEYLVNNPRILKSNDLIKQLNTIEKKSNGSISAKSGYNDDLFMASCFCAFAREKTKLDILPLIKNLKTNSPQVDYKKLMLNNLFSESKKDSNVKPKEHETYIPYQEQEDQDDDFPFVSII